MKSEGSDQLVGEVLNIHQLFNSERTNHCLNLNSIILIREKLTTVESALYNVLLHINKDFPFFQGEFTFEFLKKRLEFIFTNEELVDVFGSLVSKGYIECAFDVQCVSVSVKLI